MNNSGASVSPLIKSKKDMAELIVVYDDIDLPLGKIRISYNRSSGGHRGVESIIRKLKSEEFSRIRIGITPASPSGKLKKPKGEKAVITFLMGVFKDKENQELKKVSKTILEAMEVLINEGRPQAMSQFNK
jgi:PTH1 family peptidyl-tRNA hydrolase